MYGLKPIALLYGLKHLKTQRSFFCLPKVSGVSSARERESLAERFDEARNGPWVHSIFLEHFWKTHKKLQQWVQQEKQLGEK